MVENNLLKSKTAAMEMSVGTIVTIVLLVSVLILGIFLIQKIFTASESAIDLTEEQLFEELSKLFSKDDKLVILPQSRTLEIKHEEREAIGIGIKNLATTGTGTNIFSYKVTSTGGGNCPSNVNTQSWIIVGESDNNIPIRVGEIYSTKIIFEIPIGTPLCTERFRIDSEIDGTAYKSGAFDISVRG